MLPFCSLNGATTPGAGVSRDLEGVANCFTVQTILTGAPSSFTVKVEGSLDGSTWDQINPVTINSGAGLVTWGDNPYTPVGNSGSFAFAHYVRYVRAYLTAVSGGTSPTVTVWLVAADIK